MIGKRLATLILAATAPLALAGTAAAQAVCGVSADGNEPQSGFFASATGSGSLACGRSAVAADLSTSIGASAGADPGSSNMDNVSVGNFAGNTVSGQRNTAAGSAAGAFVTGSQNTAYGYNSGRNLTGDNNIAIGQNAGRGTLASPLTVNNSIAIGANSLAGQDRSIAIGTGVTTARAGQVAIGDGNATYTLAGLNSTASKAAQTGPAFLVTSDGAGNIATASINVQQINTTAATVADHSTQLANHTTQINTTAATVADHSTQLANHTTQIAGLDSRVRSLDGRIDKAYEGAAMAMAMSGGGLPADKNFAVSINWGGFEGENAFAGTAHARINDQLSLNGGIGVGASGDTVGARAGLTLAW